MSKDRSRRAVGDASPAAALSGSFEVDYWTGVVTVAHSGQVRGRSVPGGPVR